MKLSEGERFFVVLRSGNWEAVVTEAHPLGSNWRFPPGIDHPFITHGFVADSEEGVRWKRYGDVCARVAPPRPAAAQSSAGPSPAVTPRDQVLPKSVPGAGTTDGSPTQVIHGYTFPAFPSGASVPGTVDSAVRVAAEPFCSACGDFVAALRAAPLETLVSDDVAARIAVARGCWPCLRGEHPYWHPVGTECPRPVSASAPAPQIAPERNATEAQVVAAIAQWFSELGPQFEFNAPAVAKVIRDGAWRRFLPEVKP